MKQKESNSTMSRSVPPSLLFLTFLFCGPAIGQPTNGIRIEEYRATLGASIRFESSIFNEERKILVGLPSTYDASKRHPVIVILEGEILFETTAVITRLMADVGEIPPSIIIGIPVGDRQMEYAPPSLREYEDGNADRMLDHFRDELFPLLDSLYTLSDERIIWSHSALGGTFCTYLLLGPDTQFTGILSSSPNLRWVQGYVEAEEAFVELSRKGTVFYYLTFGDSEGEDYMGEMFERVQHFKDRLLSEAPDNLVWQYRLYEGNNHFTNAMETYIDGLKLYFDRK